MQALVLREFGGPEVLRCEEVPTPTPGPGEVLVHVHAVSVNRAFSGPRWFLATFGDEDQGAQSMRMARRSKPACSGLVRPRRAGRQARESPHGHQQCALQ